MPYSVYRLDDPSDNVTHYIGLSKDPYQRYATHLLTAGKTNLPKDIWVQELREKGLFPALGIVESDIPDSCMGRIREDFWIQKYRDDGAPLTNVFLGVATHSTTGLSISDCQSSFPDLVISKLLQENPTENRVRIMVYALGGRFYDKWSWQPPVTIIPHIYRYAPGKKNNLVHIDMAELTALPDEELLKRLQMLLNESEKGGRAKSKITVGQVPEGYELVEQVGSYFKWAVRYHGQIITNAKGNARTFVDEFNATLFCWKHVKQVASLEAKNAVGHRSQFAAKAMAL